MLELVLVPPSVEMVTNCVLVIVVGRGIELVTVAGRGIELVTVAGRGTELVLGVEGNESVNKLACEQPEVGDSWIVNLKKGRMSLSEVRLHLR
jgi:hypothetical protein